VWLVNVDVFCAITSARLIPIQVWSAGDEIWSSDAYNHPDGCLHPRHQGYWLCCCDNKNGFREIIIWLVVISLSTVKGLVILCLCILFGSCFVVSTSAIDCPERLVPKMTKCVSSGTLNSTHSLTLSTMFRDDCLKKWRKIIIIIIIFLQQLTVVTSEVLTPCGLQELWFFLLILSVMFFLFFFGGGDFLCLP